MCKICSKLIIKTPEGRQTVMKAIEFDEIVGHVPEFLVQAFLKISLKFLSSFRRYKDFLLQH